MIDEHQIRAWAAANPRISGLIMIALGGSLSGYFVYSFMTEGIVHPFPTLIGLSFFVVGLWQVIRGRALDNDPSPMKNICYGLGGLVLALVTIFFLERFGFRLVRPGMP